MKTLLRLMLVCLLVTVAAPAYSGDAVQMWKCEMDDDATEEQVKGNAAKWLKAAKTMPGGENLQAFVLFPIAVNGVGEMDLMFVVVAPSFEEWGKFWDAYADSSANAADELNAKNVACPDSVLWESFKME
jgi:hypothetical protein